MDETLQGVIVILVISMLIVLGIFTHQHIKSKVLTHSSCLKELEAFNDSYSFDLSLSKIYMFFYDFYTRRDYERMSLKECLRRHMMENFDFYSDLIFKLEYNNHHRNQYIESAKKLRIPIDYRNARSITLFPILFRVYERVMFGNRILNPPVESTVRIQLKYRTPSGQMTHTKTYLYYYSAIKQAYHPIAEEREYKLSLEYQIREERLKMTNSMRYDVLRRDNFKCVICGRTQKDGIKLHVDHIFPVSKGGQTVLTNLQTLCEECNVGKSNKI